jgi:hypothetical protein
MPAAAALFSPPAVQQNHKQGYMHPSSTITSSAPSRPKIEQLHCHEQQNDTSANKDCFKGKYVSYCMAP